jgi:hypothetical protein
MKNLCRIVAACLTGISLSSCGGGGGDGPSGPPTPVLTTLTVSFQTAAIQVGQTANASASGLDQNGAAIGTGTVTWSTASAAVATVNSSGVVTGVGAGTTQVIGSAGGKTAQATVTVEATPVATVTVTPPTATIGIGGTQQMTATTLDANSNVLTGRVVTWASADPSRATVNASSGLVTGVAAGQATITATSEGRVGSALITVSGTLASCTSSNALQIALGQIVTLTAGQKASLCLGAGAAPSEYVLIPFNSLNIAGTTVQLQISGTNTTPINPGSQVSLQPGGNLSGLRVAAAAQSKSFEPAFREREKRDLASAFSSFRQLPRDRRLPRNRQLPGSISTDLSASMITGMPATPVVGTSYQINGNLTGNTCSSPKQLRAATAIAVLPHTIVLWDETSPAGGWTASEMAAFGQAFEDNGYQLNVTNFGAPSDVDTNGRVVILFTPSVNAIPAPPGATVGGLFASRDLFPITSCIASNEGEMFYMPVPDPNSTINGNYTNKTNLARGNLSILVHEFQHLINAGRRLYVNGAGPEEIWLNEGLSHIAEELLYYQASTNATQSNIDLARLQSSQAQLDAVNNYQISNLGRALTYMKAPEINSPFSFTDALEMRGAIWQLLRYSADRRGGSDQATWFALVNTTNSGQENFNAVFGNIITNLRDMVVAQFTDDAGLGINPPHIHPSWNFRSVLPAINSGVYPLATRALSTLALDITLNGGGASYVRFRVAANLPATIASSSAGQPVPAAVDFILVRTQ